jgi:hypothetical protein
MFKESSITRYVGKTEKSSFRKKVFQPHKLVNFAEALNEVKKRTGSFSWKSGVTIGRRSGYGVLTQELSPFTFMAGVNQYAVFDGPFGY